jgi:hypothetical protein
MCLTSRWLAQAIFLFIATNAPTVMAQEIQSRTVSIPAPKEAFAENATRSLGPAEAFMHLKQSKIQEHHLPIPVRPKGIGTRSFRSLSKGPETPVFTTISGEGVSVMSDHPFVRVETSGSTASVSEPTLAARSDNVLVTANWFAAFSKNGGKTFQAIKPWELFPQVPANPFCCDQVAVYDKRNDLMVWLLQYDYDDNGNFLRLAVAQGDDIPNQRWRYYDLAPSAIGKWANTWFDFPNLTVGLGNLYISSNVYSTRNVKNPDGTIVKTPFERSVMLRIPLRELSKYQGLQINYFDTQDFGGLRATQGASDVMYFGANADVGSLRVFSWPETGSTLSFKDLTVQDWDTGPPKAVCPDQNDWMYRVDTRLTAAWSANGDIGFAWTTPQDSFFRFPQVRMAVIRASDMTVVAQPIVWNNEFAFALPAVAVDPAGDLGISLHFGGNHFYPSHAVGILHPIDSWTTSKWDLNVIQVTLGQHGPSDGNWGDYGGVRALDTDPTTWLTVGYTLQGTQSEVQLDYVQFVQAPTTPGGPQN